MAMLQFSTMFPPFGMVNPPLPYLFLYRQCTKPNVCPIHLPCWSTTMILCKSSQIYLNQKFIRKESKASGRLFGNEPNAQYVLEHAHQLLHWLSQAWISAGIHWIRCKSASKWRRAGTKEPCTLRLPLLFLWPNFGVWEGFGSVWMKWHLWRKYERLYPKWGRLVYKVQPAVFGAASRSSRSSNSCASSSSRGVTEGQIQAPVRWKQHPPSSKAAMRPGLN